MHILPMALLYALASACSTAATCYMYDWSAAMFPRAFVVVSFDWLVGFLSYTFAVVFFCCIAVMMAYAFAVLCCCACGIVFLWFCGL